MAYLFTVNEISLIARRFTVYTYFELPDFSSHDSYFPKILGKASVNEVRPAQAVFRWDEQIARYNINTGCILSRAFHAKKLKR